MKKLTLVSEAKKATIMFLLRMRARLFQPQNRSEESDNEDGFYWWEIANSRAYARRVVSVAQEYLGANDTDVDATLAAIDDGERDQRFGYSLNVFIHKGFEVPQELALIIDMHREDIEKYAQHFSWWHPDKSPQPGEASGVMPVFDNDTIEQAIDKSYADARRAAKIARDHFGEGNSSAHKAVDYASAGEWEWAIICSLQAFHEARVEVPQELADINEAYGEDLDGIRSPRTVISQHPAQTSQPEEGQAITPNYDAMDKCRADAERAAAIAQEHFGADDYYVDGALLSIVGGELDDAFIFSLEAFLQKGVEVPEELARIIEENREDIEELDEHFVTWYPARSDI